MSSYELIMMVLGVCVSGSTAAVHTGDADWVPLEANFFVLTRISESDKHWASRYQSIDGL